MGVAGGLCLFDHEEYLRRVVPAFRAGAGDPLIAGILARPRRANLRPWPAYSGLARVMGRFDESLTRATLTKSFRAEDGRETWGFWDLAYLFERVLTETCFSHYAHFGKQYPVPDLLVPDGALDADGKDLLEHLSSRAIWWKEDSGICGWLDAKETGALHQHLSGLREDPTEARVLELFSGIVRQAVDLGRGLLWGQDLGIGWDAERYPCRVIPIPALDDTGRRCKDPIPFRCIVCGGEVELAPSPICIACYER